ncbi:MAG: hypothetical protein JNM25_10015 [Planctomycetes bacterium]|nr:hypothetical protein [Planctomycetota bacterium]
MNQPDSKAAPQPTPQPIPPRPQVEHTHWSFALVAFYLSCAATTLGAGVAASGFLFFESIGWLVFGCVLSLAGIVGCFVSLTAARKPAARN